MSKQKSPIRILFVCHGNICRSPMAESILTYMVKERGWEERFLIDSAATSMEEIGSRPHYGTVMKLRSAGIPVVSHRARRMTAADYHRFDYLIGMDWENICNMTRIAGGDPEGKIFKLLSFAGLDRDVADPWYTDDFDAAYDDIVMGTEALLRQLQGI